MQFRLHLLVVHHTTTGAEPSRRLWRRSLFSSFSDTSILLTSIMQPNLCPGNFLLGQVARRVFPEEVSTSYLCPDPASHAKVIKPAPPALALEIVRFVPHLGEYLISLVKPDVAEFLLPNIAYCQALPVGAEVHVPLIVHVRKPVPRRTAALHSEEFFHLLSALRLVLCNVLQQINAVGIIIGCDNVHAVAHPGFLYYVVHHASPLLVEDVPVNNFLPSTPVHE